MIVISDTNILSSFAAGEGLPLLLNLPSTLDLGERESIAVAQIRNGLLLTNDKRAIKYCQRQTIDVLSLTAILRLLWTLNITSAEEVRALVEHMSQVEGLRLTSEQEQVVFAPTD